MAGGVIYQELNGQATAQAYQEIYRLLSWMAMGMVVRAFLLNKNRPGEEDSTKNAMH
jgi:DHA2 family multidrug resistance protein